MQVNQTGNIEQVQSISIQNQMLQNMVQAHRNNVKAQAPNGS